MSKTIKGIIRQFSLFVLLDLQSIPHTQEVQFKEFGLLKYNKTIRLHLDR